MAKLTILPSNVSAEVPDGENLIEAGETAGVEMEAGCFNCSCGTCVAEVVSGMDNLSGPSDEELDHDFLWRHSTALPERGRIGIHNRSWYEEVLVVRVHPQFLAGQKLPPRLVRKDIWAERIEDIAANPSAERPKY